MTAEFEKNKNKNDNDEYEEDNYNNEIQYNLQEINNEMTSILNEKYSIINQNEAAANEITKLNRFYYKLCIESNIIDKEIEKLVSYENNNTLLDKHYNILFAELEDDISINNNNADVYDTKLRKYNDIMNVYENLNSYEEISQKFYSENNIMKLNSLLKTKLGEYSTMLSNNPIKNND